MDAAARTLEAACAGSCDAMAQLRTLFPLDTLRLRQALRCAVRPLVEPRSWARRCRRQLNGVFRLVALGHTGIATNQKMPQMKG